MDKNNKFYIKYGGFLNRYIMAGRSCLNLGSVLLNQRIVCYNCAVKCKRGLLSAAAMMDFARNF